MPFSSVLGASSVIKPGVCTSTTRPSVPYEGQLIYETDTDKVASYNGSAWVYTATSGLVYVTGASFSGVTSVSAPNNTFTSTYKNYRIMIEISAMATAGEITVRLRTSGSDNTTSNYGWFYGGRTSNNTADQGGIAADTSFEYGYAHTTTTFGGTIDFIGPQTATRTTGFATCIFWSGSVYAVYPLGWAFNGTTQFDSFTLISSSSNSMTGTYRVYGYSDS